MSRGSPSMIALLGLLAVAGYQNRDKIAEMLNGRAQPSSGGREPVDRQGTTGSVFERLGGLLGGGSAGSVLSGGLSDLVERFRQSGHGHAADSWVSTGPNQSLRAEQIEQAIGPDVLSTLSTHTGLSKDEILSRLTKELPDAVDKLTPAGRVPTEDEAARLV